MNVREENLNKWRKSVVGILVPKFKKRLGTYLLNKTRSRKNRSLFKK